MVDSNTVTVTVQNEVTIEPVDPDSGVVVTDCEVRLPAEAATKNTGPTPPAGSVTFQTLETGVVSFEVRPDSDNEYQRYLDADVDIDTDVVSTATVELTKAATVGTANKP